MKEEKDIIIEDLLKNFREQRDWTYNDVAYKLNDTNIMPEYIKKMESGLEYPDLDLMFKLSELYGVPVEVFVKAKECSYERMKNSFQMRIIKWMNYLFGISFKVAMVVVTLFYVIALVGSFMFFISKMNEFHKVNGKNTNLPISIVQESKEIERI